MTELMERGPVPIDRFEISRRRWHLHEIARHIVVGARAADAEIRTGRRNQRLGAGLDLAWWRRDNRSSDLLGQTIALVGVDNPAGESRRILILLHFSLKCCPQRQSNRNTWKTVSSHNPESQSCVSDPERVRASRIRPKA